MNIPNIDMNNPQVQMLSNILTGQGMSAEQVVRNICQQRGIDVDEFIKSISKGKE